MPPLNSQICSLPMEILHAILRAVLDEIVKCDMMTSPKPEHRMLPGGQSFPHTMALVCRYWRDIVFSMPVLWTRIFCEPSKPSAKQILSYQLKKTGSYPVDLTIIFDMNHYHNEKIDSHHLEPHIGRLRSLRISNLSNVNYDIITPRAYAPWLECLRLENTRWDTHTRLFDISCSVLRILVIDEVVIDPQWLKNNLTRAESVTILLGYSSGDKVLRALSSIPRRIPSFTLECLVLPSSNYGYNPAIKIGAEKVIMRGLAPLSAIDDHCKTIVLQECNIDSGTKTLPSSNTLELDRCFANNRCGELTMKWDGDTVIITNGNYFCIQIVLNRLNFGQWSRVTTLKLIAKDKFKMRFSVSSLKSMVDRRSMLEDALKKSVKKNKKLRNEKFEPIRVLHVHGGPPLSRCMRSWFEKRVEDFVWDYRRS